MKNQLVIPDRQVAVITNKQNNLSFYHPFFQIRESGAKTHRQIIFITGQMAEIRYRNHWGVTADCHPDLTRHRFQRTNSQKTDFWETWTSTTIRQHTQPIWTNNWLIKRTKTFKRDLSPQLSDHHSHQSPSKTGSPKLTTFQVANHTHIKTCRNLRFQGHLKLRQRICNPSKTQGIAKDDSDLSDRLKSVKKIITTLAIILMGKTRTDSSTQRQMREKHKDFRGILRN